MNPLTDLQAELSSIDDLLRGLERLGAPPHLLAPYKQKQQDLAQAISLQAMTQSNQANNMASAITGSGGLSANPFGPSPVAQFQVGMEVEIRGGRWGRHGSRGIVEREGGHNCYIRFHKQSDAIDNANGFATPDCTWWVDNVDLIPVINSSTSSTMAGPKKTFTQGDRVYLMRVKDSSLCRYTDEDKLPVYGKNGNFIAGTVLETRGSVILIKWDNRHQNHIDVRGVELMTVEEAEAQKKKKKNVKLDTVHLDKLVLKQEMKDEILSVLKQHEHSSKMFDDWGIGEIVEYGRGMTLMFWGGPGTGKTWGAHCISKALGTELLVVSAGDIQSSEPGGANRAISEAFASAKSTGKVLFIDECDSLITVRSEVGMILASEINTLLTEIEKFEGVLIMATNRIGMMDEALERRIALTIEFPEPDFDARVQIWKKMLPKKMPLHSNVLVDKLAEEKLTGGQIKNALLQAARLALAEDAKMVTMPHFEQAIKRIHKSRGVMGKGSNLMMAKAGGSGKSRAPVVEVDKVSG